MRSPEVLPGLATASARYSIYDSTIPPGPSTGKKVLFPRPVLPSAVGAASDVSIDQLHAGRCSILPGVAQG